MSAAEQENDRKHGSGPGTASSSAAFEPASAGAPPDLSFERLLAQLEAEGERTSAEGSVSQSVSPLQSSGQTEPGRERDMAGADASVFAPASGSGFAPASLSAKPFEAEAFQVRAPEPGTGEFRVTAQFAPTDALVETAPQLPQAQVPGRPEAPVGSSAPVAAAKPTPPAAAPFQEQAGEFTRIFTQLPTPRSAPPAILAEVAPSLPAPAQKPAAGEFTQFFQALDSSKSSSSAAAPLAGSPALASNSPAAMGTGAPGSAAVSSPTPAPAPSVPSPKQSAMTETVAKSALPATAPFLQSSPPLTAAQSAPGQSTPAQAFAPAAIAPAAPAESREASQAAEPAGQPEAQPAGQPGTFTAFFQAASPAPSASSASTAAEVSASQARAAAPAINRTSSPAQEPAFPAAFAEPPRSQPAGGGGFTELMQSLGSASNPAAGKASPFSPGPAAPASKPYTDTFSPAASPAPQAFAPRGSDAAFAPAPQNPPRQPDGAGRPGEFTQLMQSLQAPQSKTSDPAALPAAPSSFFDGGPQISSGGPSEFTRVMQGSAARSAEAPVANFAPAPQASGAAVGLPIAAPQAPKAPALPTAEAKTKLQAMMPWLLAANGALLLLLIALAYMFLRHRH